MYIGRIVCIARTPDGRLCASYRVSSRSFPNRRAVIAEDRVSIVPTEGNESDVQKNPYIAYNCARLAADGRVAVVTNGSHTDPITEKIDQGMPVRDALAFASLTLDYEKDQYNTPRVSTVADSRDDTGWLAVVRDDGLEIRKAALEPGRFHYVATYEENRIDDAQSGAYPVDNAAAACEFILGRDVFAKRERPITAVAAFARDGAFEFATRDAPRS